MKTDRPLRLAALQAAARARHTPKRSPLLATLPTAAEIRQLMERRLAAARAHLAALRAAQPEAPLTPMAVPAVAPEPTVARESALEAAIEPTSEDREETLQERFDDREAAANSTLWHGWLNWAAERRRINARLDTSFRHYRELMGA
jgi:hypothetical protein